MDELAHRCICFSEVTMMKARRYMAVLSLFGMLALILDARTALSGAQGAVELCLTTVLPSLFPFFVLSELLSGGTAGSQGLLLRPLGKLLGIPAGSEGLFFTGSLGGYPSGARAVHQAWQSGTLDTANARRMLSFCSNAGPAFLFGILGQKFPSLWMVWLLWGIHLLSAVAVAAMQPHLSGHSGTLRSAPAVSLTSAVEHAVGVCGQVCGWIVLCRVVMAFCLRWFLWLLPEAGQVAFYGLLELTGGCCALENVKNVGLRFVLCAGLVSFGGLCVAMQTASVTGRLGMASYWWGKGIQCVLSMLFAYVAQLLLFSAEQQLSLPMPFLVILVFPALILMMLRQKSKKASSIPAISSV